VKAIRLFDADDYAVATIFNMASGFYSWIWLCW